MALWCQLFCLCRNKKDWCKNIWLGAKHVLTVLQRLAPLLSLVCVCVCVCVRTHAHVCVSCDAVQQRSHEDKVSEEEGASRRREVTLSLTYWVAFWNLSHQFGAVPWEGPGSDKQNKWWTPNGKALLCELLAAYKGRWGTNVYSTNMNMVLRQISF